ncbi:MAG: hypothetical protein K5928_00010 [Prevotella sp.]|nr:hypothetical protein [Prevotella sp.]
MKKILVTMMALALTIAAQAQQYVGINTYTYDYGLSGRKKVLKMQRDWNVKYNELWSRMYNGTMQVRTERYPYDQLELTEQ